MTCITVRWKRVVTAARIFPLVLVAGMFLATSASAQISLVRLTTCGPTSFPTSCTIPATGSGNLLVIGWASNNGGGGTTIANVTDNAGNAYLPTGARAVDAVPNTMADVWYAKNSVAGATSVTVNPNPAGTRGTALLLELSGVDTVAPLDSISVLNSQAATTTPAGAPITLSSSAELVISIANVQGTVIGLVSGNPFTSDSTVNGNGWAHLIGSSVGTYRAQWSNPSSGSYGATSVSFKAGASSGALNACDLTSDGLVNSLDVNSAVNMVLGLAPCTANIQAPGVCDIVTVQRVVNATLPNGTCLTGTIATPHTVTLNWVASVSAGVTGYNIYRGTSSGGPYTKLNSAIVNSTSYVDTTVQSGTTYYYVATAWDGSNESGFSTQAQAVVPTP